MTPPVPSRSKDKSRVDSSVTSSKIESSRHDRDKPSKDGDDSKSKKSDSRDKDRDRKERGREKNGSKTGTGRSSASVTSNKGDVKVEVVERVARSGTQPTHKAILVKVDQRAVVDESDRVSRSGSEIKDLF